METAITVWRVGRSLARTPSPPLEFLWTGPFMGFTPTGFGKVLDPSLFGFFILPVFSFSVFLVCFLFLLSFLFSFFSFLF